MRHIESNIQKAFVRWFRLKYPQYALVLTSVPNGGVRSKAEAAIMKGEGMVAGAADLLLLVPCGEYGALGLEFKTPIGRQSPAQKAWQAAFETAGNRYAVVRSVEEAIAITNDYLNSGVM